MKHKILFVSNGLDGGGTEKLLNDMLPRINAGGAFECDLLILFDNNAKYLGELQSNGVSVAVLPKKIKNPLSRLLFIKNYIKRGGYSIVHANLFPSIYYCSVLKKLLRGKFPALVMTEHNTDNRRRHRKIYYPIEKFIYRSFDHVISITEQVQDSLCKWLKLSDAKTERFSVVLNGVPLDGFKNAGPYLKHELAPSLEESDTVLCMVGSFTDQKNHAVMLETIKRLPARYKLVLVGEGPLYGDIYKTAQREGLLSRVIFLGFRKDVAEIMHTSDIIVIPSLWEGFGLVAAEAMACGKPVVFSGVPGLSSVVRDTGIKVTPPRDRKAS